MIAGPGLINRIASGSVVSGVIVITLDCMTS